MTSALLLVAAGLYARGAVRLRLRRSELCAFAAGWFALCVALTGPLDRLKDVLFSAHMGQHELLMLIAAPLLVAGNALLAIHGALPWRIPAPVRVVRALTNPIVAVVVHGLTLWIWHVPALYQACLHNAALHAFQHFTFFSTAALFWWTMIHGRFGVTGYGMAVAFVFVTAMHSSLLGVLLTFAKSLWYPEYGELARVRAIDALQDQQLAGLLMWVPAGAIFTLIGLALFAAWLGQADKRVGAHR